MSTANPFGTNTDRDEELEAVGLDKSLIGATQPAVIRDAPVREKAVAVVTERRVRIILEDNENIGPTGQFFGVNGKGYMLKSNMEADVPLAIIDILNNAKQSVPIVDPVTMQVTGFRDRLRFPYRVVQVIEPDRQAA